MQIAAIAIVIALIVAGISFYTFQNADKNEEIKLPDTYQTPTEIPTQPSSSAPSQTSETSPKSISQPTSQSEISSIARDTGCKGQGIVNLTSPPRRLGDIELIEPIGLMIGGHVTPIDHGYYYPPNWRSDPDPTNHRDVLAPADGVIASIGIVGFGAGDYRLEIYHTCTFYTIYIHVKELSPRISQLAGTISGNKNVKIPVTAGEIIGKANAFDFSVHNSEVILPGFVVPEHYGGESWKIHTVDMFDYFVEPIKSQLLSKNIRNATPFGGKIDYDIDGRLIGNWFKENTNWYAGTGGNTPYWKTHFALAYDALDPTHIIISLGDFNGEAKQFGVKGNIPDPATISKESGMVKYELVTYEYKIGNTGQFWDRKSYATSLKAVNDDNRIYGIVLLQLIEDRKLKLEVFPGKTVAEVAGFTNAATIYER